MPGHDARRSAWRCVLHNCRKFTLDRNACSGKNTRKARTTFLRDCNLLLYQLRHTYLMKLPILVKFCLYFKCIVLYYTILHILYYTILYYTILYYTILYYTILYYTILYYTILYYTILLYYTVRPTRLYSSVPKLETGTPKLLAWHRKSKNYSLVEFITRPTECPTQPWRMIDASRVYTFI